MEQIPEVVSSQRVFDGRIFKVRIDEIRYDDGAVHRLDIVEHGGSFGIIALTSQRELVLVRQYRHAVRKELWEIPAGTAHPGEDPIEGAARELREETGYSAGRLRLVGSCYMTPGFCDEIMHFVLAEALMPGEQALDEDERIEVGTFAHEAAWRLVGTGEIADIKTILALLWTEGSQGELPGGFGR